MAENGAVAYRVGPLHAIVQEIAPDDLLARNAVVHACTRWRAQEEITVVASEVRKLAGRNLGPGGGGALRTGCNRRTCFAGR
jgi:hypothetical protein